MPADEMLDRREAREALALALAEIQLHRNNEPSNESIAQLLALIRQLNEVEPLSGTSSDSGRVTDR